MQRPTSVALDTPVAEPLHPSLLALLGPDVTLCLLCAAALAVVGQLFGSHYVLRLSTMLLPGCVAPGILAVCFVPRARAIVRGDAGARDRFRTQALATLRDWAAARLRRRRLRQPRELHGAGAAADHRRHALPHRRRAVRRRAERVGDAALSPARHRLDGDRLRQLPHHADVPRHRLVAARAKWDTYSPLLVRASFPSLHCAYATLTSAYAWRYGDAILPRRCFFWLVLPLELSLIAATIYLRHHWIPDIAAGVTLGLTVCTLAPFLRARWPR